MKLGVPMLAAALALGSVAFAQAPTPSPDPNANPNTDPSSPSYQNPSSMNKSSSAGLTMTKGQVVSSDSRSNTLVVKVENKAATGSTGSTMGSTTGEDMSFVVGPDTKILKGSKKASLSEVSSGDRVTVNYRTVGGKNMAVSIGIEPSA
jgi:hypothetical protein